MRDCSTFFEFQSFGSMMIEESRFINAGYSAFFLEFTDAGSTPNQITIRNCLFKNNDNSNNDYGIAFFVKCFTKMDDEFSFNLLSINNTFINYRARGKIYTLSVTLTGIQHLEVQ